MTTILPSTNYHLSRGHDAHGEVLLRDDAHFAADGERDFALCRPLGVAKHHAAGHRRDDFRRDATNAPYVIGIEILVADAAASPKKKITKPGASSSSSISPAPTYIQIHAHVVILLAPLCQPPAIRGSP